MDVSSLLDASLKADGTLEHMLDVAPEAYLFADAGGLTRMASRRLKEFFGLDPAELMGKNIGTFADRLGRCFTEATSYHEVIGYPLHEQVQELVRDVEVAAPTHRFLQVHSAPVRNGTTFAGRLWTLRDITVERQIEDLKIQYGGVRSADELKSLFLTVVSHQLRTPLNSVRWNLEMLLSGEYPAIVDEPKDVLKGAYKSVVNSIGIIDDMVLAMHIEERALRLEKVPTDLGAVVAKVVHTLSKAAELKDVSLTLTGVPKGLPPLVIDADKIGKVLTRIIDNAIKYTPAGGRVAVAMQVEPTQVHVSVSDSGVGILQPDQAHVFERFYRAARAIEINPNGSGLGLYISKFIVDAHDGDITFKSNEGAGSTFIMTLPRPAS